MTATQGVVHVHSAPSALCPHVEWALGGVLGVPVHLTWTPQPAERGTYRAEIDWRGPVGSSARLASAMRRWDRVRFEITEQATLESEGARYSYTPALGVFQATCSRNGDVLVHEDVLARIIRETDPADMRGALERALGRPWDAELEVFRAGVEPGADVRWLHRVG